MQEAELLLQQLMTEQQDVDTLREAVEKEREEIAWETEYVAKLAEVRGYNVTSHLSV